MECWNWKKHSEIIFVVFLSLPPWRNYMFFVCLSYFWWFCIFKKYYFFGFFGTGSYCIVHADLELMVILFPLLLSIRVTGMPQHVFFCFKLSQNLALRWNWPGIPLVAQACLSLGCSHLSLSSCSIFFEYFFSPFFKMQNLSRLVRLLGKYDKSP